MTSNDPRGELVGQEGRLQLLLARHRAQTRATEVLAAISGSADHDEAVDKVCQLLEVDSFQAQAVLTMLWSDSTQAAVATVAALIAEQRVLVEQLRKAAGIEGETGSPTNPDS